MYSVNICINIIWLVLDTYVVIVQNFLVCDLPLPSYYPYKIICLSARCQLFRYLTVQSFDVSQWTKRTLEAMNSATDLFSNWMYFEKHKMDLYALSFFNARTVHVIVIIPPRKNKGPLVMPSQHYNDVIMSTMSSQITSLAIFYSTVYSGADQRKHQSSESLAFVWGIHRWPVNSPHKGPVSRKMFPFVMTPSSIPCCGRPSREFRFQHHERDHIKQ